MNDASKSGYYTLNVLLGDLYYFGTNVNIDLYIAEFYYKEASVRGIAEGQYKLRLLYYYNDTIFHRLDVFPK